MGNTFSTQGCLLLDYNPLSFDFDMGSYLFRKCPCGLNAKQRFEECLTFLADIIHVLMNYLVKGFRYTRKDSNGEIIRNSMTRVNPASLIFFISLKMFGQMRSTIPLTINFKYLTCWPSKNYVGLINERSRLQSKGLSKGFKRSSIENHR